MGAPEKNQNARKAEAEKASATIFVYLTRAEKAACARAARGRKLSEWARKHLLRAARG